MQISLTIAGITPLLMNKFTDAAAEAATQGTHSSATGQERDTPRAQAEQRIYYDEGGNIVIPQPNLLRCIMEGGRFFKTGKKQITTQRTSLIPACLDIDAVSIKLLYRPPWEVDTRPVRIPSTGARILWHRPAFYDWSLSFIIDLDTTILNQRLIREIIDAAGKRIGLGDFRPDTKGPFGKFVVTNWSEDETTK